VADEVPDALVDDATIDAFVTRLETYAAALTESERRALATIILRAMDPLERMRWRDPADLLDPREEAVLRALEHDAARGKETGTWDTPA
jgi:hypothetical protein